MTADARRPRQPLPATRRPAGSIHRSHPPVWHVNDHRRSAQTCRGGEQFRTALRPYHRDKSAQKGQTQQRAGDDPLNRLVRNRIFASRRILIIQRLFAHTPPKRCTCCIANRTLCGVRQVARLSPEAPVALRIKLVELNRSLLWGLYRMAKDSSCAKPAADDSVGEKAFGRSDRRIEVRRRYEKDSRDPRMEELWLRRSRRSSGQDERCG